MWVRYKEGRISLEEALRNADSRNNLRLRINLDENPDTGKSAKEELKDSDQEGTNQANKSLAQGEDDNNSPGKADSLDGLSLVSMEDEGEMPK